MDEVKIWILLSAVTIMSLILGFMIRIVTQQVIKRLDEIVNELKQLTKISAIQEQQISELKDREELINSRLNNHAVRIRSIEMKVNQ